MTKRALICSYGPPPHDRDSGARRLWHLIGFLRDAGWSLTFLTSSAVGENRYAHDLLRQGIPVHDGTAVRPEDVIAGGRFDLALCAFWQVAELYLPVLREVSPQTAVIVDSVDLHFVREARRAFAQPGNAVLGQTFGGETTAELNVYAAADAVLAVSRDEAELVGGLVCDPGMAFWVPDAEDISESAVPLDDRAGIVFVGSFRHLPNVDALEYFCTEVVPQLDRGLLERHPVTVVGDGLDERAPSAARRLRNVHLVGWTPSLEPYVERARVSVVPLRYGAGTKRKVLQSLLLGTPVVTTSVGAEGLSVRSEKHVLVADDAGVFAEATERLLQDDALWGRLSKSGRERVAADHNSEAVRKRLLAAVESALARPRKRPMLEAGGRGLYEYRTRIQDYQKIAPELREAVRDLEPVDGTVLVFSESVAELLQLGEREARHFPPLEVDGAGARPSEAGSAVALELLRREIEDGAAFLVAPKWIHDRLHSYPDVLEHLQTCESQDLAGCIVYRLAPAESEPTPEAAAGDDSTKVTQPRRRRSPPGARLVAFYLPQFHPIPENDAWWGEGFTEWTNVTKAEPLFGGHYQPHVPADLGFYDLRLAETREAQAELAREAGIEAFCYYHYWFGGKRLLGRPFDDVLASGRPDFPFCLCWANEPWSRRWDGQEHDVLQPQTYSAEDDLEHIRWLIPALSDPRALTVDGKPVFIVYQARDLPDPAATVELWRREARSAGLPGLQLLTVETGWDAGWDATTVGFDGKVLFQPQFSILQTVPQLDVGGPEELRVYDYGQAWPVLSAPDPVAYPRYETVCAGWDNSPRTGERGWALHNSNPESYEEWLRSAIARAQSQPRDRRLVFLNAWNEWAEGAHLEPDARHGRAYLEATRRALDPVDERGERPVVKRPHPVRVAEPVLSVDDALAAAESPRARAFAFYLPQFHPIPENDEWWGRGFTEWTNVVRARPLFPGHYQPHLPTSLGFYDLRTPEVRERQAELAREHGVEAFCYWHYWFLGKRLLERPLDEVRASGRPDFPFLLAWANETWSRRWLGEDKEILIKQAYSSADDLAHAHWLAEVFAEPNYVKVHGRPAFLIYRPTGLPEPRRTTEVIRTVCAKAGLPDPFLLGLNAFADIDYRSLGFDGTVDFEPQLGVLANALEDGLKVCDYGEARRLMQQRRRGFDSYPSIVVSWDNTPRRGENGIVFSDANPETFEQGLREMVFSLLDRPLEDRLLFLNAWNEWAEGNHLEPDRRHGTGYLEAVRRVVLGEPQTEPRAARRQRVLAGVGA